MRGRRSAPTRPCQPGGSLPNTSSSEPWNHNLHYHRAILGAVPPGCERALDVGCGQGALTRLLRQGIPQVTGIDRDQRSIELARAHPSAADIDYVLGDFLSAELAPASMDLVTSVAVLHHMDFETALRRMSELLRPGGVLAIIGLARNGSLADLGWEIPAMSGNSLQRTVAVWRRRDAASQAEASYQSPVAWPPPLTYAGTRRLAKRVLPAASYRRQLYWRYSLVWTKPA